MKLLSVTGEDVPRGSKIVGLAQVGTAKAETRLYYQFSGDSVRPPTAIADAFAAAMLIPAMARGEPLEIIPPISWRLHLQLPRIRDIFYAWYPEILAKVPVITTGVESAGARPVGVGTFFSGGVDSFYTYLKYAKGGHTLPNPLTDLIFMRGVETPAERSAGVDASLALVQRAADAHGVSVIAGDTNVRSVLEGKLSYARQYHGSLLASVALALSGSLGIVCIPSAYTYNHLVAHGSTPLTDEMFSGDEVAILHDGSEEARSEKVARIVEWDEEVVLSGLRVCWRNKGGASNCGECEKCVRTAVSLAALRVLDRAKLFAKTDRRKWAWVLGHDSPTMTEENLAFVKKHGADPQLMWILRTALALRRVGGIVLRK